jgi:hypothetical protein
MGRPVRFDFKAFEDQLFDEYRRALARLGRAQRAERFFAVTLYGVYRELDGALTLPLLAAGTESSAPQPDKNGFYGARWSPHEWKFTEIPLRKRQALALERALIAEATRGTQAHWLKVEARYMAGLVRLAQRLRKVAPALLSVTDDFVCFVHDEEGGSELAARTIAPGLFTKLFGPQVAVRKEKKRVAGLPQQERAAFLVTRFGQFDGMGTEEAQAELLKIGEPALDALLSVIGHPKNGWTAAMLVGQIGISRPDLIDALRQRAAKSHWHATALGMLGDYDWLAAQPPKVVVHAMVAPLLAVAAGRARPLDYRPLEKYLDRADRKGTKLIEEELEPGRSYVSASKTDVPEALRALSSRHAVVRWHAASLLGERSLGQAQKVLPALSARLSDPHPWVRRLAVLSISYWKAAAKPYRPAIEALRDDPDETLRRIVEHVLGKG